MHQGAAAYAATAKTTVAASPRELEAHLLLKAARQLQTVFDNWGQHTHSDLMAAIAFNRKLWTILGTSATRDENPLPQEVKNNVGSLAVFIFKRSLELEFEPEAHKLSVLVQINRNLAAGLQSAPAPAGA